MHSPFEKTGFPTLPDLGCDVGTGPRNLAAVRAGLTEKWSSGSVERFVHRLELLKRHGYGRAGCDLSSARVMAA